MDQEMTFSLSYEQLTRFAEKRIRECNLDSHGVTYLCESAKAGAVLIFWHELAINGYTSMNAIKRQERHCCKVSDEAAFCLIQRPYISKTLLTRRISPRGSP